MPPIDGKEPNDLTDDLNDGGEDEDFGAAFEEFASEREAPAGDEPAAAAPAQTDPDDEEDDTLADPAPPAPTGGTNEQAAPSGPAEEPSNDPWANVPAELKAEFDRVRHQLASTTGRLSAADRRLAELTRATGPAGNDGGDAGNKDSRAAQQPASFREKPEIKQLLEDYADVAGPLVSVIEDLHKQLAEVQQPVKEMTDRAATESAGEQFQLVMTRHPDIATVVNDPRYVDWLGQQPRAVREAYERNSTQVVDGEEAAWVIDQFKAFAGIKTPDTPPSSTPTPTPTPTPSGPAADARRQRQLDGNRDSGGSRGTAQPDADPDDLDAAFNHFASKAERKRQRAFGQV